MNSELKVAVISLLEEVLRDPDLLPQERKATTNILRYKGIAVNIIVCFFLSTHCPRIFFYNRQGEAIDCAYKIDLVTMLSPLVCKRKLQCKCLRLYLAFSVLKVSIFGKEAGVLR